MQFVTSYFLLRHLYHFYSMLLFLLRATTFCRRTCVLQATVIQA